MINNDFWRDKKVFLTGHTGFKGTWLSLWLNALGAKVIGYSLQPPTEPNLFSLCRVDEIVTSIFADVRNAAYLKAAIIDNDPDIVIHMAAQPLVIESYKNPVDTYATNVMGTVNLLEAVRHCKNIKSVLNVTTDKCYENKEWLWGYRENEPMGGYDPYSNSKACSELVTSSYRNSFFNESEYSVHGVAIASVRAGNVIGGGDWAADRLIPDCLKALSLSKKIQIRNPHSIRPWQHVLEPLNGYLTLAEKLYQEGTLFAEPWNFGSNDSDAKSVEWIVKILCQEWGRDASYIVVGGQHPHEAHYLKLDCSKAKHRLGWMPKWNLEHTLKKIIEWHKAYLSEVEDMRIITLRQIEEYAEGIS